MGIFSTDFYDKVKDERIVGKVSGAFTYEQGKGGAMKRACDLLFTQNYVVQVYTSLNGTPGIFGFSSNDTFKDNIGNTTVTTGGVQAVSELNLEPKSISEAMPFEKIELVSVVYFTVGGGLLDNYKQDVGLIHFRVGGKFLGMRENVIFTQSQFDNVVNLINMTPLKDKMEATKELVGFFTENSK